jgi:hypothetical protein
MRMSWKGLLTICGLERVCMGCGDLYSLIATRLKVMLKMLQQ